MVATFKISPTETFVSIITFSDSYYDFVAENNNSSNKRSLSSEKIENVALDINTHINENGDQFISFSPTSTEQTKVELIDVNGKVAATLFDGLAESTSQYSIKIDKANLSGGIYLVHYKGSKMDRVKKILIVK